MTVTDFHSICEILGKLYSTYRDDDEFEDFINFNDLGLPLAYLVSEKLCEVSNDGAKYIAETWTLFLSGLNLEDKGFNTLEEVLALAEFNNDK